jgi:hypothetical protein
MVTHLDAAVVFASRLNLLDFLGGHCFKIAFDVGLERWLVVLDSQKIVGPGIEHRLGDVGGLHPMASIETRDLVRFFIDRLLASTSRLLVAKADTKCRAFWPVFQLWLRRKVLPSIATQWSLPGQHSATHDEKQTMNRSGSIRFITVRSQSAQGMPSWNSAKSRRNGSCAFPQSTMSL